MKSQIPSIMSRVLSCTAGLAIAASLGLAKPAPVAAQADLADRCQAIKAIAAAGHARCLTGELSRSILRLEVPNELRLFRCYSKFVLTFLAAEERTDGACPSSGDAERLEGAIDTCVGDVVDALGGAPGEGGEEAVCQAVKARLAGIYATCKFGQLSRSLLLGGSPDFSRCESLLSAKWTAIENRACATTGDQAAVQADLDACSTLVADSLDPVIEYEQDFESLDQASDTALADDGWLVFANVFDPGMSFLYNYGAFPAPNGGAGFSGIDIGQGGPDQGSQQLVVYNDYDNTDHGVGNLIEANVFRERTIVADDVGRTLKVTVQAKRGNINDPSGNSTALAFIKTLDPSSGYAQTNFVTHDTTSLPIIWTEFSIALDIDAGLEGQILQYGFSTTATNYEPSGNFYDNIVVSTVPTP